MKSLSGAFVDILSLMLVAAILAFLPGPSIQSIDALVKAKDINRLSALLMPLPDGSHNPFRVVRDGGAYEVGRFGWTATDLPSIDSGGSFVVIGTRLTSEDTGQLVFERVGDRLRYVAESTSMGIEPKHHDFTIRFHPQTKSVDIVDRVLLHSTGTGSRFLVRMSPQYLVSKVLDKDGGTVPFTQTQGVVLLSRPMTGDFTYRFEYSAVVDQPGYAGSISETEATLTNDYWYPMVARYPASYTAEVHAPLGWTPIAQGERTALAETSDETVANYQMDLPVTYYSVSAAPYKTFSQLIDGRRFSVWSLRMSLADMKAQTELYAPILKFYEQFSPFPFSGYGAVDSAVYGGGALEAYSFATYGGGLPSEEAHEPSHTWWGGILDNTYMHSFWNESFAVFSDGLYHRNVPIGNVAERRRAFIQSGAAASDYDEVSILDGSVEAGTVSGSLGYGKGSKVLQMLEQLTGTPKMIQIMHDWIAVHPKGEPAEWEEFEKVAEKDCPALSLETFFHDWLARPGSAKLNADVSNDGAATYIRLKWASQRFRMPLLVLVRTVAGIDSYQLFDTAAGDTFSIPGPKPALISIDPFRQCVRDVSDDEIPLQLDSSRFAETPKWVDPSHPSWDRSGNAQIADPNTAPNLSGTYIVGSPESLPWLKPLCDKVGFTVRNNVLTYKGTSINLDHGSAAAIVELPGGNYCKIGLGKTRVKPEFGMARLVVTDDLGRFLRGVTDPKIHGKLTYRL